MSNVTKFRSFGDSTSSRVEDELKTNSPPHALLSLAYRIFIIWSSNSAKLFTTSHIDEGTYPLTHPPNQPPHLTLGRLLTVWCETICQWRSHSPSIWTAANGRRTEPSGNADEWLVLKTRQTLARCAAVNRHVTWLHPVSFNEQPTT